jgi:hypothetical protein
MARWVKLGLDIHSRRGLPFSTATAAGARSRKKAVVRSVTFAVGPRVPFRGTEEWGRSEDLSPSRPVRHPTIAVRENGTNGGRRQSRRLRIAGGFAVSGGHFVQTVISQKAWCGVSMTASELFSFA